MILTLLIIGGLIALTAGGELLIRGASNIASALGISALVIGLTVVSFGTSAPELVVTIQSSLAGNPNLAVANVVGSNIFNVLFILGLCALFLPLVVSSQLIRIDVPILIFASFLLLGLAGDQVISTIEGFFLFFMAITYTVFLIVKSRSETKEVQEEFSHHFPEVKTSTKVLLQSFGLVGAGLALLVLGGKWLVSGAVEMATTLGVSDTVIGLTIVAIGTSLPEVATSVVATIKGERDIAIGNVVGSGIYNIFLIVGLGSVVAPGGLTVSTEILFFDLPIMLASAVVCLPIFLSGFCISRWEGALFLFLFTLYMIHLVLNAVEHSLLQDFRQGFLYFVAPALALSLLVICYQALNPQKKGK